MNGDWRLEIGDGSETSDGPSQSSISNLQSAIFNQQSSINNLQSICPHERRSLQIHPLRRARRHRVPHPRCGAEAEDFREQTLLITEEGKPFFYLGDAAWELFHRLNREEAK